jgi:3-hydroxyisobutyrate dehydrogenase-like beta-hydroxyacid dehydrogenase
MAEKRVGVVGVGAMGQPMAACLLRAGYAVTVCAHRNRAPVEELVAQGAREAADPAGVAAASDVVITMVPDAPQVEEACFGDRGIAAGKADGRELTVIDMSTISPVATRAIAARLGERGIAMLDAPVSGGPARAITGDLTIMVGGDDAVVARHRDVLEAMGSKVTHVGPIGHGEIAKLTNNIIIGVLMPALGEALTFAAKAGADVATVREIVLTATGGNYLLDKWLPQNMLQDKYEGGFALELMHKDLGAALAAARDLGVPLVETGVAYQLFAMAKGLGYGREDYSAVSKLTQDAANITIATGQPRR